MNLRSVLSGYAVLVGTAMIAMWGGFLLTGVVPELEAAPLEVGYHLVAEVLTALALVVAGVGLVTGRKWADRLLPASLGMLLYTVINSAGYYANLGEWAMVLFFSVLTVTTLAALGAVLSGRMTLGRHTVAVERRSLRRIVDR